MRPGSGWGAGLISRREQQLGTSLAAEPLLDLVDQRRLVWQEPPRKAWTAAEPRVEQKRGANENEQSD